MGPPFDDDEEDTQLTVLPRPTTQELAAEDVEFVREEITAPHDAEEWLGGFKRGVSAFQADWARATKLWARAFGFTDEKAEEISRAIQKLAASPSPPPRKKD